MADPSFAGFQTLNQFLAAQGMVWPVEWFGGSTINQILNEVYVAASAEKTSGDKRKLQLWLMYTGEYQLKVPGLDVLSLVLTGQPASTTVKSPYRPAQTAPEYDQWLPLIIDDTPDALDIVFLYAEYTTAPTCELLLPDLTLAFRVESECLKPADDDAPYVDITFHGAVKVDSNFDVKFEGFDGFVLPRSLIGDSGIAVRARDVKFDLSRTSSITEVKNAGFGDDFLGMYIGNAEVDLPDGLSVYAPDAIILERTAVGTGGVSGTASATFDPQFDSGARSYTGTGAGSLFGIPFGLKSLGLTIKKNAFVSSSMTAEVWLPYFEKRVNANLRVDGRGGVAMEVTGLAAPEPGDEFDSSGGLLTLNVGGAAIFRITSIGLGVEAGKAFVRVQASVQPTLGGLSWPSFEIRELVIDSDGKVRVEGGWIALPKQACLDLYGFTMEITKLGFGATDDGGKWIGCSGAVALAEGIAAGASVEGLRVFWGGAKGAGVSLNGVGLAMAIPGVLALSGKVSLENQGFRGAAKLMLEPVGLEVDARVVVGNEAGVGRYMGVYLDAELPAGIPLFSTGLAIYGFAGVFAYQFEPDKASDQKWYDWYRQEKNGAKGIGFYEKWRPVKDSMAFGAGVTLGTVSDNGYAFNGRFLLLIVLPGPILMVEGRASLCKARGNVNSEGTFRALAVLDRRAGTFQLGLDAQYKYGALLDISGSAEAFFNFNDATDWHVWIGQKEREKRIRASLFKLFQVNAYFMLNAHQIDTGAGWSYGRSWKFGPFRVGLQASLEEEAIISWRPSHFTGTMDMEGKAELKAFGRGVSLKANAGILVDVFDPYKIRGEFKVRMDLPWPLPDLSKTVTLEWRKSQNLPSLPQPVQEVAIEHLKTTTKWPLAGSLVDASDPPPADSAIPVIPVDSKIGITFARPVSDAAGAGENGMAPADGEWIGNPSASGTPKGPVQAGYSLESVTLEKWYPGEGEWHEVAKSDRDQTTLHGMWANVPPQTEQDGVGIAQTKLLIGSKTPFDYAGHTASSWDEWFSSANPNYPCVQEPEPWSQLFDQVPKYLAQWVCPDLPPSVEVDWIYGGNVTELETPIDGIEQGLESWAAYDLVNMPQFKVGLTVGREIDSLDVLFGYPKSPPETEPGRFCFADVRSDEYVNPGVFLPSRVRSPKVTTFDSTGAQNPHNHVIDDPGGLHGLVLRASARFEFFAPASSASFELYSPAGQLTVDVFDDQDQPAGSAVVEPGLDDGRPRSASFSGTRLAWARVVQERADVDALLLSVRLDCPTRAWAVDRDGTQHGPFDGENGRLTIVGRDLATVRLNSIQPIVLARLDLERRVDESMRRTLESTERFKETDEVFEPNQKYRLKIVTATAEKQFGANSDKKNDPKKKSTNKELHAYFNTAGPPAILPPSKPKLATGEVDVPELEDLGIYVAGTTPVSQEQGKPKMSRLYRAYDVGIDFNEPYVELMYRAARRDLRLCLVDSGNERAPSAQGWLTQAPSAWTKIDETRIKETIARWIATVNRASCSQLPAFPEGEVVKDDALVDASAARILKPKMQYEARLIPLLLHETFGPLSAVLMEQDADVVASELYHRWTIAEGADSDWTVGYEDLTVPSPTDPSGSETVRSYYLAKASDEDASLRYVGGASDASDAPGEWQDLLIRVKAKWSAGKFGIAFRQVDSEGFDALWADQTTGVRKVVSVRNGSSQTIASDTTTFSGSVEVAFSIEVVGRRVRVWQDGIALFDVEVGDVLKGTIRLFGYETDDLRISDVTVEDLRGATTVACRFSFVTSAFASFLHQLQSGQDVPATMDIPSSASDSELSGWLGEHASLDSEARDFDKLAARLFPGGVPRSVDTVELTKLRRNSQVRALLVQSPEPIDWTRAVLEVMRCDEARAASVAPGDIKLVDVAFSDQPGSERVDLLVRGQLSLTGYSIEYRSSPAATPDGPWSEYYVFGVEESMSDGTLVRVSSAEPGSGSPRCHERFVADAANGSIHFDSAVEVRLVAPSGVVVHQRVFSDGTDMSSLTAHLLRNREGTAFLIVPPKEGTALGSIPPGQLRCQLSFALAGDGLPTLRFAGSSDGESATIEATIE